MNDGYLLIIDGSSLLSTQFYGNLPPAITYAKTPEEKEKYFPRIMQTSSGVYTNGIFGFFRYLLKVLRQQKPTHLAVAWDLTRDTFRRKMCADYKANRSETIVPLREQFALCQEILRRIGVRQYMSNDFEADDFSGSLAARFEREIPVRILTKDRDYLQLANEYTVVWLLQQAQKKADELFTKYGIRREAPTVAEKAFPMTPDRIAAEYGVYPESVAELKAIAGDPSDNIKGVPGIGEKTALSLIAHYRTVAALYEAVHEAGEEGAKALAATWKNDLGITKNPIPALVKTDGDSVVGEEAAKLSRALATIKRDIPIEESLEDLAVAIDYTELKKVFEELEIRTIPLPEAETAVKIAFQEKECNTADAAKILKELGSRSLPIGLTKVAEESNAEDWQVAFGLAVTSARYMLAQDSVKYIFRVGEDEEAAFAEALSGLSGATVYVFGAKEHWCGIFSRGSGLQDVALMDYLLRPLAQSHDADAVFTEWNGEVPKPELTAEATLALGEKLSKKLDEQGMKELFLTAEMPLCYVLADMESAGIAVDTAQLGAFSAMLRTEIDRLTRSVYEQSGTEFNINSPKQLAEVLFDRMHIPYPDKKKKSGYSTNADILEMLRTDYPIVDSVLTYRQYSKLYSTYAEGLHAYIAADGRIHTTFTQTVTATGRLSSVDPNLQNIPARTELGRDIRKAFIPKEGCVFVDADYSQIELRLMAHLSGDRNLQKAYHDAADIHRLTASQVLGIPYEEVTPEQRGAAKAVNFGILYGISSFSLAQDLGISRAAAEKYIEHYFERFPGVRTYLDRTIAEAKKNGFVRTLYGRIRPIPELSSESFQKRAFGERVAMNSPIQGTAADIMKLAMIAVDRALRENSLKARVLVQVHDELLLEVPEDEAEKVSSLLKKAMESVADLAVPLECEVHRGSNWLEAKG